MIQTYNNTEALYLHNSLNSHLYYYPIHGLIIDKPMTIGKITFFPYESIRKQFELPYLIDSNFNKDTSFAEIDLLKFGNYSKYCSYMGSNSLALQLLKQYIGAIYLSIFNTNRDSVDYEKRIVITDTGKHELDCGFSSYLLKDQNKIKVYPQQMQILISAQINNFDINNIADIIAILDKSFEDKTDFDKKICKSLEILYDIYSDSSSRGRIVKWPIILNYIFKDSKDINIHFICKQMKTIFNIIKPKEIYEYLPSYFYKTYKVKDISKIISDIYDRVRNKIMHGEINFYEEYSCGFIEDLILLKISVLELLNFMASLSSKFNTTTEFLAWIKSKEFEYSEMKRTNK